MINNNIDYGTLYIEDAIYERIYNIEKEKDINGNITDEIYKDYTEFFINGITRYHAYHGTNFNSEELNFINYVRNNKNRNYNDFINNINNKLMFMLDCADLNTED
jgi:hypothetical protein